MLSIFKLLVLYTCLAELKAQVVNSSLTAKTLPKFTQDTVSKAENIVLYDNIPLNTGILKSTY